MAGIAGIVASYGGGNRAVFGLRPADSFDGLERSLMGISCSYSDRKH